MNPSSQPPTTTQPSDPKPTDTPPPPVGENLSIETMRALAEAYHARSFTEQQPVDDSDYGYTFNKADSAMQFGVAEYVSNQQGFAVTHSIATFRAAETAGMSYRRPIDTISNKDVESEKLVPAHLYIDVIDITVPYILPHVVIASKVPGLLGALLQSFIPQIKPAGTSTVRLEGDFSEFVYALTNKGEDVTAFTYLAPDVMELALPISRSVTVEWIGNHIYLYYSSQDATLIGNGFNTELTGAIHEKMLQTGLAIADKLGKNARPGRVLEWPVKRMPRTQATATILGILLLLFSGPLAFASLFVSYMVWPPLTAVIALVILALIGLLAVRLVKAKKLRDKYELRYGKYAKNIDVPNPETSDFAK